MDGDSIPVNPKLPPDFDNTPNDLRPTDHLQWCGRPYIETMTWEEMSAGAWPDATEDEWARWLEEWRARWFAAWPSGTRYDVRCLDGGAWDRSTNWGVFATLDEAIACAKSGPSWRRPVVR